MNNISYRKKDGVAAACLIYDRLEKSSLVMPERMSGSVPAKQPFQGVSL